MLSGTTSCRSDVVWICTNSAKSSHLRSVSNSMAYNIPIEMQILEKMVFISGGASILLDTCLYTTTTLPDFVGPLVCMAEFWVAKTYLIWFVNCFSLASGVAFLLFDIWGGSGGLGEIVDNVGYFE